MGGRRPLWRGRVLSSAFSVKNLGMSSPSPEPREGDSSVFAADPAGVPADPERLIAEHQAGVWRFLRAAGCEPNLADDLTQEAFLMLLRRPFLEYSRTATAAYLRRIAMNLLINLRRREGRVRLIADPQVFEMVWLQWTGDDSGEELLAALKECFQKLTPRARLSLEMRFRENASREEIAAALGISEHGAKNLMQRSKAQLRTCIEQKQQRHEHDK
jgi:RNA polymerase sigma-70 factor (ECF subfamily)